MAIRWIVISIYIISFHFYDRFCFFPNFSTYFSQFPILSTGVEHLSHILSSSPPFGPTIEVACGIAIVGNHHTINSGRYRPYPSRAPIDHQHHWFSDSSNHQGSCSSVLFLYLQKSTCFKNWLIYTFSLLFHVESSIVSWKYYNASFLFFWKKMIIQFNIEVDQLERQRHKKFFCIKSTDETPT